MRGFLGNGLLGGGGGGGLAPGTVLLVFADGQYNRQVFTSVDATYHTSAITLARTTGADVPRIEDRGDGAGPLWLFEGDRIDIPSKARLDSTWTVVISGTFTPSNATGPDGVVNSAGTMVFGSGATSAVGRNLTTGAVTIGAVTLFSVWARGAVGGEAFKFAFRDHDNQVQRSPDFGVTTTWARYSWLSAGNGSGATVPFLRLENKAAGGVQTIEFYGVNGEEARAYPTSTILNETSSEPVTCPGDSLIFNSSQIPDHLLRRKWQSFLSPAHGSADIVSGNEFWPYSFGSSSDGVRLRHNGTNVKLELVSGGAVAAASNALTYSRHAVLDCKVDLASGIITVDGSSGPTGSAVVLPSGAPVRVGGIVSGHNEFFGRISQPLAAA